MCEIVVDQWRQQATSRSLHNSLVRTMHPPGRTPFLAKKNRWRGEAQQGGFMVLARRVLELRNCIVLFPNTGLFTTLNYWFSDFFPVWNVRKNATKMVVIFWCNFISLFLDFFLLSTNLWILFFSLAGTLRRQCKKRTLYGFILLKTNLKSSWGQYQMIVLEKSSFILQYQAFFLSQRFAPHSPPC